MHFVSARERVFYWCAVAMVGVLFIATFRLGLIRGFDHIIAADAWGRMVFAIGAAITDLAHGGRGYIVFDHINTVLTYGGLTGEPGPLASLGLTFPANLQNATLIDAAIAKAVEFQPAASLPLSAVTEDLGMVDFVKLGFLLFGFRLVSLFLIYFVLLGASVAAFLAAFQRQPVALAMLATTLAAHFAFLGSDLFDLGGYTFQTVTNPKIIPTLALVPGLHLGFAMFSSSRPTGRDVLLVTIQSALIVFAVWVRAPAIWVPFAILALALTLAALAFRRAGAAGAALVAWPAGLLIAVWLLQSVYASLAVNPVYRERGDTPHHTIWHPIYYSLQLHPSWEAKYGASHNNERGDRQPQAAVTSYLEKHPPPPEEAASMYRDKYGTLKTTVYERYVRKAFFEFLANDPGFVAATFLVHKPVYLAKNLLLHSRSLVDRLPGKIRILLVAALVAIAAYLALDRRELRHVAASGMFITAALGLSTVPLLITVPIIAENVVVLATAVGAWLLAALSWTAATAFRYISIRRLQRNGVRRAA
jgi:hypothetical protein